VPLAAVCVICQLPDRILEHPQVCQGCRARLARDLAELPDLIAEATQLTQPAAAPYWEWRLDGAELGCANRVRAWVWRTPPSGPTGSPGRVRVTGTRTAPLPVSVELLNLVGPGAPSVSDPHGDQVGELPPRWWLLDVARDWADQQGYTMRTRTTLVALVDWLGDHLHWACDHHPAIADFAAELRRQRGILRNASGRTPARPQLCEGVACRRCDIRSLWRVDGRVSCANCGTIYEPTEYDNLVREQKRAALAP
jgi:hypothetical protein